VFLSIRAKILKFSRQNLRTYQSFTDLCVFQHSRQIFKLFKPKLSRNQSLTYLCISSGFAPARENPLKEKGVARCPSLRQCVCDICGAILPYSAPKFQIFPAKTPNPSIIYSLPIPLLHFSCIRAKISKFFPLKLSTNQSHTDLCVFQNLRQNFNFFTPKLRILLSFTAFSSFYMHLATKIYHFPSKQSTYQPFTASFFNLLIFSSIYAKYLAFFLVSAQSQ
jgi:hypothetical protein